MMGMMGMAGGEAGTAAPWRGRLAGGIYRQTDSDRYDIAINRF